ncbi:MAG: PQQ-dependent sugar dehydrogenase [Gemmatimonadales bacterium]
MTRTLLLVASAWALGSGALRAQRAPSCDPAAGLSLPDRFCALIVADSVGRARHLVVAPNGDLFVALRGDEGGVLALRDTTGDGEADVLRRFGPAGGTGIALDGGHLYFATDDAVVRWAWAPGRLEPAGAPDTVVAGLLNRRQHAAKGIAIGRDGGLYVNVGAPSNACQEGDRQPGAEGQDPCPLLEVSGGVWRFETERLGQTQADGERFATGLRNTLALAIEPASGALYGAQHGRDVLHANWPDLFTEAQGAEQPAEELFRLERGGDYGWPYCYYDPEKRRKVLAPEYGGDGETAGRCAEARTPAVAFPAHWAPNGLAFYAGTQFPARYRGGVFVAFHGSWNRAPLPQQGYNVTFVPFAGGRPAGAYEVFADGFAGPDKSPGGALHRPSGVAVGPDGSLYVSDDKGGRIYRILYR